MFRRSRITGRAAPRAALLAVTLLLGVYALSVSAMPSTNPLVPLDISRKVYIVENGVPSDKVAAITLECRYLVAPVPVVTKVVTRDLTRFPVVTTAGPTVTVVPPGEKHWVEETLSGRYTIRDGKCAFRLSIYGASEWPSCKWEAITLDGETIAFPSCGLPHYNEMDLDIATGLCAQHEPTPAPPMLTATPPAVFPWGPIQYLPSLGKFAAALLLAWALEVPVLFLMLHFVLKPSYRDTKRLVCVGLLATLVTLPLAWYAAPLIRTVIAVNEWVYVALVEALVVAVEAALYAWLLRVKWWQAALVSLLANALSFLAGWVLL